MNILQLATVDSAGGAWFFKDTLDRHTDHECRAVRMYQSQYQYPHDLLDPPQKEIDELYAWADLVHVHDEAEALIVDQWAKSPKPVVITHHGTRYRRYHDSFNERSERRGSKLTVSTIDLTAWGAEWLPYPRHDMADLWKPAKKFNVVHAPTNRERKRTGEVIAALRNTRLTLIEDRPYAECLEEKAKGHALVDSWLYGYGNNSIEAWAMGMPTVSGILPEMREMMLESWDYLPFVETTVEGLAETVARLRDDDVFYSEVQDRGRDHFMRYHHAPAVAARLVDLYEEALDG